MPADLARRQVAPAAEEHEEVHQAGQDNAIVTWTTEYYGLAIAALRRGDRRVEEEVLAHLWPSHHENVNFYGTPGNVAKTSAWPVATR